MDAVVTVEAERSGNKTGAGCATSSSAGVAIDGIWTGAWEKLRYLMVGAPKAASAFDTSLSGSAMMLRLRHECPGDMPSPAFFTLTGLCRFERDASWFPLGFATLSTTEHKTCY